MFTRLFARDSSSVAAGGSRLVILSVAVAGVRRRSPPGLELPADTSFEADGPDDASSLIGMEDATLLRPRTSAKRRKTLCRSSGLGVDGYSLGAGGLNFLERVSGQPKSKQMCRNAQN